jgi:hypothetical protein
MYIVYANVSNTYISIYIEPEDKKIINNNYGI